jgi:molybdenum cofactor cytidylyltransferase
MWIPGLCHHSDLALRMFLPTLAASATTASAMPPADSMLTPLAIIPAAGKSRRMGAPKLLLDVAGRTVIARLIDALRQGGVAECFVVTAPGNEPLSREAERAGGRAVVADVPPPDMRTSVELGLAAARRARQAAGSEPAPDEPWLLAPADHPAIDPRTVELLLAAAARLPGRIIVPTHARRRGHPTVFAWKHAALVAASPAGSGLNRLLQEQAADVVELETASAGVLIDLDTPGDYERLRKLWENPLAGAE